MTLTNYWWIVIWLFSGGLFFSVFYPKQKELVMGKQEIRWRWPPALLTACPYVLWAATRVGIGDSEVYRKTFLEAPGTLAQLPEYVSGITKDKGFYSLLVIIKSMIGNNDVLYFFILALIQMICLVVIFRKYSCDYWFSLFVFVVSTDYISWMYNGVRQFTAVTIIYAATALILKKKYILTVLVILFASTIHGSALLMLPIIFIVQGKALNKKTLLCIAASIIALVFIDQFTNILNNMLAETQYTNVVSDWKTIEDDGINPIRVLVYSVPTILAIVGLKCIREANDPVINLATNASVVSTAIGIIAMGTSGIFIGRLPIYVSLYATAILLPWEIENMFTRESARLVKVTAIVCYIGFFYYQMHITWGWL